MTTLNLTKSTPRHSKPHEQYFHALVSVREICQVMEAQFRTDKSVHSFALFQPKLLELRMTIGCVLPEYCHLLAVECHYIAKQAAIFCRDCPKDRNIPIQQWLERDPGLGKGTLTDIYLYPSSFLKQIDDELMS